jgi:hypothetical protein
VEYLFFELSTVSIELLISTNLTLWRWSNVGKVWGTYFYVAGIVNESYSFGYKGV